MNWTKEQYQAIHEFGTNIIVSAGAGSGKTEILSQRVLEHVKNGISIDEMLILTFTNAAALEMKERIRKKLIENNLLEESQKVDIAYITTFDAYALSILKKYSYVLNIANNISVIDESIITLKKEELLRNIFDEYYTNNNELFIRLINDFCIKDDNDIINAILNLNNNLEQVYDKENYLLNYVDNYYEEKNINRLIDEYIDLLLSKIKQINVQLDNIKHYVDEKYYTKLYDSLSSLLNSKDYESIKYNLINLKMPSLPRGTDEMAKIIKNDKISNIKSSLEKLLNYNDVKEIKESIYSTKDYVTIIIEILLKFDNALNEFKKGINSFEFSDIAKMAIKILNEHDKIRKTVKNKYKEILIDEYQDTNDLQDLFMSLIENNNQYMVGDIKQSIYRFRNANPKLFKEKYDAYSKNNNGIKIDLNRNFRSRNNVLDGINLIFNLIMDKDIGGASYFDDHQMIFGQDNYLSVNKENYDMEFLNYTMDEDNSFTKEEIEVFTIAKDIKDKINNHYQVLDKKTKESRDVNYSDFAILMDRSKLFNLYKKVFEYLNIPVTIMKDSTITDSIDLSIIKNIYYLVIHHNDKLKDVKYKYAFVSLARSYLFAYSDNEILEILNSNSIYKTDIYNICKDISSNIDILTNKKLYELIIDKFDIYNKLISIGDINNHILALDNIENIMDNADNLGYTIDDFYNYLNNVISKELKINLSTNNDNSNSVKIMTIHTSKGLEYPICYYPLLYPEFNFKDVNNRFYYSNIYGFVTPYVKDNNIYNTIVKELVKNDYIKEEVSEKLRLFYVALTRAKEKIIYVGSLTENIFAYKNEGIIDNDTRLSYKKFIDILNSIYSYIKKYIKNIDIHSLGLTKDYNFEKKDIIKLKEGSNINIKNIDIKSNIINKVRLSKNIHELYSKEDKKSIDLGLKMHYLLEITDFNNPIMDNLNSFEKELLQKFLDTKIYIGATKTYKELEFFYNDNNEFVHGIIDLLLVFNDKNIIVDYKLKNISDEAYKKQLDGYKKYISTINDLPTSIYLYSIMDGQLTKIK